MLLMGRTLQEIMAGKETLIFLLQNLGFVINLKKSILQSVKQLEFLGLQINIEELTMSQEGKLTHIIQQCQEIYTQPRTLVSSLTVPIALLRRTNIRTTVYLDDMLLIGRTLLGIMTGRNILIFLLQNLRFVINLKKSILQPVKQLEFLWLQINIEEMILSPEEKLTHIIQQCQEVYSHPRALVLSLTKLIGLRSSTFQAMLLWKIQFRFLQ